MQKIGFGGSCHWCTEAIFQSLRGVVLVEQGWIASDGENTFASEAVAIQFDPGVISLQNLIAIHLHTHSCTTQHSMRGKYRSAIYTSDRSQQKAAREILKELQSDFDLPVITLVLPFRSFKLNDGHYLNYYYSDPNKPFCQYVISPKLQLLKRKFAKNIKINL